MQDIANSIKALAKDGNESQLVLCSVSSVNTTKKTCVCVPKTGGADYLGVKLMAKNKTGFYIIPEVDSDVVVCIQQDLAFVTMFSDVSEIQLNGDNYGGIPIVQNLVDKLNNLENAFNQHILLYNAHTHAETTVNTLVPATLDTNVLIDTTTTDLENKTVSHGNG